MKYTNVYGMYKQAVFPCFKTNSILPKAMLFLQLFFAASFLSAQCEFPTLMPTCGNSVAILEPTEADLSNLVCDGSATMSIDVAAGGLYRIIVAEGNTYAFSFVPSGNNTVDPIFPGVMDLYHDQTQTMTAATSGPVAASAGAMVREFSYTANPNFDNELFLAVFDKSCAGNWKDYTLTVSCTSCTFEEDEDQTLRITPSAPNCMADQITFDRPVVTGPCDESTIQIVGANTTAAEIVGNQVMVPAGLGVGIHTIEFQVTNCSGDVIGRNFTTNIIIEPFSSCGSKYITLNDGCSLELLASHVINSPCTSLDQYTVNVQDANNNVVPNNIVTAAGVYQVAVSYTPTEGGVAGAALDMANVFQGKSLCWSNVTVEDKTGPTCNVEDTELNFIVGKEGTPVIATYTDCSGNIVANDVLDRSFGACGVVPGVTTDTDNNLYTDFSPLPITSASTLTLDNVVIPAPMEAEAMAFNNAGFTLESIRVLTYSAGDGTNTGSSCNQFVYIWRPSMILPPQRALLSCGDMTSVNDLAGFDPQLVPHYANPLFLLNTTDTSTGDDFMSTNIVDPSFINTRVDDEGNPEFIALIGVDHAISNFTVTNEDDHMGLDASGITISFRRNFLVLDCCTNQFILDGPAQVIKANVQAQIECPADVTIACMSELDDESVFGEAVINGLCSNVFTVDENIVVSPLVGNTCSGTLTRTFTMLPSSDPILATETCMQTITIRDEEAPTLISTFDEALIENISIDCSEDIPDAPTTLIEAAAIDNCGGDVQVDLNESLPNIIGTCPNDYTIMRTWTLTDMCGNAFEIVQVITVENEDLVATDFEVAPFSMDCMLFDDFDSDDFELRVSTNGSCDASTILVVVDPFASPTDPDDQGNRTKTFTYTVSDACGFNESYSTTVTFTDCCINLVLPAATIGCTGTQSNITVNLPPGSPDITQLTFMLTNTNDPSDTQKQDQNNVFIFGKNSPSVNYDIVVTAFDPSVILCGPVTRLTGCTARPAIAGRVFNEEFVSIEDVEVELMNTEIPMSMTNIDGEYVFEELTEAEYTVTPHKENEPANGVTTLDLVVLAQHVLKINELSTPYKLIAADVNMDQVVDIRDMLELRQLILFAIDDFTINDSWRFIDANYIFPDPQNPWIEAIPSARTMELGASVSQVDFVAVKIGDLDCSARTKTNFNTLEERSDETLVLTAHDKTIMAGTKFEVALSPSAKVNLSAAQFTIDFDPTLADFNSISSEAIGINESNVNKMYASEGLVPFAWSIPTDKELTTTSEMVLSFTAKKDLTIAELFQLDSELTPALAFTSQGKQYDVQLNIQGASTNIASHTVVLHQNQPNPFLTNTIIGFEVDSAQPVSLAIFDIDGKLLYTRDVDANNGYNSIQVSSKEIAQRGVMFYQLNTADYSVTKKMIILE